MTQSFSRNLSHWLTKEDIMRSQYTLAHEVQLTFDLSGGTAVVSRLGSSAFVGESLQQSSQLRLLLR